MAELDVVVTNYQTPEDLDNFCESLEAHGPVTDGIKDYTLAIMNVAPKTDDLKVANKWESRHVIFHNNVGYGIASNHGAALNDSPIIALMNADVAFPEGSLRKILDAMDEHPDWSIVGPRQISSENIITHAGIFGEATQREHRGWRMPVGKDEYTDSMECNFIMGSAFFVRRGVWNALTDCPLYQQWLSTTGFETRGAFLPTPLYFEETWACVHAKAHGFKVMYYGGATLIHEWHGAISKHLTSTQETDVVLRSQSIFTRACQAHGIQNP